MRVAFIICSNGLGHYKRCFRLVYDWLLRCPKLRFDIYCERWQLELTREWIISKHLSCEQNINLHFDKLQGSIKWLPDKSRFSFSEYQAWLDLLKKEEPVKNAELVVSDNLVGVLEIRKDCLLSGSFLWSDLLKQYDHYREIEKIVDFETQILTRIKPVMICVKDIVMPAVIDQTNPKLMPWFCERKLGSPTQIISNLQKIFL